VINEPKMCAFVGLALIIVVSRYHFSQAPSKVTPDKPVAIKLLEVGKVSNRYFIRAMANQPELADCRVQLYIITYGENREIARRERMVIDWLLGHRGEYDCARTTLVRGGLGHPRTAFWKIPAGADNPSP
jgi:hypothetical protein